jgi:hypothetical protein
MRPRHVRALLRRLDALAARAAHPLFVLHGPGDPGGPRETPAHQGDLPAPPVNARPGAASDDAAAYRAKAADPAPPLSLQEGKRGEDPHPDPLPRAGEGTPPAPPPPSPRPFPAPARPPAVRVPEPSVAAREDRERAAEMLFARADYATITAWGRASGVDVSGRGRSGVVIMRVNAKRRSFGLPAFRLVNSPRPAEAVTAEFHEMSRVRTA